MIAQALKNSFDRYYEAPIEIWEHFARLCESVSYKKNQVIKEANTVDRYGYFLLEGAAGTFVWKENNDACMDLHLEGDFFADELSLFSGKPSPVEIRALENAVVLRIGKSQIEQLKETPVGRMLFSIGDHHDLVKKQQQQIEMMTKTAEERYRELLHKNPALIQRIHQKHIASYLGITPQSLSRIRRNMVAD